MRSSITKTRERKLCATDRIAAAIFARRQREINEQSRNVIPDQSLALLLSPLHHQDTAGPIKRLMPLSGLAGLNHPARG